MRNLLFFALLPFALACGSQDSPDPNPEPGPDAALPSICGPPSLSCDFFGPDCPSVEEVCSGICGAAAECCTCDSESERWTVTNYDCPACAAPARL